MNEDLPAGHQAHDVRLVQGGVRVDVNWIGEGFDCDYDPENPDDRPLYRFDVYVRTPGTSPEDDQWAEVDDSSYCTHIDTSLPRVAVEAFAQRIMDEVHDPVSSGQSVKRLCEELSTTPMSQFHIVIASASSDQMHENTDAAPERAVPGPRI